MEITEVVTHIFSAEGLGTMVKGFFFFLQAVYLFFAFMVTRQVKLMNGALKTPAAPMFSTLAYFHFLAALLILFITILVA